LIVESARFVDKQAVPTGLLDGDRQKKSEGIAGVIESKFIKNLHENGDRRYAWVFVENIKSRFIEEEAHMELEFYLPKGCYATVLLSELGFEK
jgi:tRNA pseudouridine13 synthase